MKKSRKIIAIFLVFAMLFSVSAMLLGCQPDEFVMPESDGNYTLHESLSEVPRTWNPHTWEMNTDSYIMGYTSSGFYEPILNATQTGIDWVNELASGEPVNITSSLSAAQKSLYNISATDAGRAWRIPLNRDAKWENGTPIVASDYVTSMKWQLDPEMLNRRQDSYTASAGAISNAINYYMQGKSGFNALVAPNIEKGAADGLGAAKDAELYFSWDVKLFEPLLELCQGSFGFSGSTWADFYNEFGAGEFEVDIDGETVDVFAKWQAIIDELGSDNMLKISTVVDVDSWTMDYVDEEMLADLEADLSALMNLWFVDWGYIAYVGQYVDSGWVTMLEWLVGSCTNLEWWHELFIAQPFTYGEFDFNDVGIYADGDYNLVMVFAGNLSGVELKLQLSSTWLVKNDIYEAGITTTGGRKTTTYGTAGGAYSSYGPYKLSSVTNQQIIMTKNDNWYGWTDGKHEGQFQTTRIICDIIADHSTAMLNFRQGNLDAINLLATEMSQYALSQSKMFVLETYTHRIAFNVDPTALKALDNNANGNNKNSVMISVKDFREAISMAINRDEWCAQTTPGWVPSYGLLSTLYYYSIEDPIATNYRASTQAMRAVLKQYGVDYAGHESDAAWLSSEIDKINGYNPTKATQLLKSAFATATAAGGVCAGQTNIDVKISIEVSPNIADSRAAMQDSLNSYLAAVVSGTGFSKIEIVFVQQVTSPNRYEKLRSGSIAGMIGAWGGAEMYPENLLSLFADPVYADPIDEYGFDPVTLGNVTLTPPNGTAVSKTIDWWIKNLRVKDQDDSDTGAFSPEWAAAGSTAAEKKAREEFRLEALAAVEYTLLNNYHFIPLACDATVQLYSFKINYATTIQLPVVAFGGIRFITYNYSDNQWDAFINYNNNNLDYSGVRPIN